MQLLDSEKSVHASQRICTVSQAVPIAITQPDIPLAIAIGVDVSRDAALIGAQHPVGHSVAVNIEELIVGAAVAVEIDQRSAGVLDAIKPEPPELPPLVRRHPPGPGPVVGEVRLGSAVVVEVEHRAIGDAVTIEIRERVVVQSITVEIQPESIEPAVAVQVKVEVPVPHIRRAVVASHAVVHERWDARSPLWVPARLPPSQQFRGRLIGRQRPALQSQLFQEVPRLADLRARRDVEQLHDLVAI